MIEFKLPSLGSDMVEAKLLEWRMKPGAAVKRGDVVAVVDTSKAAVEVEIWQDGTVQELITQPGETIPVGTVMALLLAPDETPETAVRPKLAPVRPAVVVPLARAVAPAAPPAAAAQGRRRISPAARKHAEDLGVNLDAVEGTGPGGAVTVEDVERTAKAPKPAAAAAADRYAEMRKAIAAAMSRSKREIPHYYLAESIPLARATAWLQAENAKRSIAERMLMAVLYLKAAALACRAVPEMNGFYRDGAFQPSAAVHAGVAISLRQGGLIAPAIHDAQAKALGDLMKDLADLVRRARAGSLRSSEMSDPTLTVTNLGDEGVEATFPVIYPPQVAIVGFGAVAPRAWVVEAGVQAIPVVSASLAADHRVSDGIRGARFLGEIRRLLQEPEAL